MARSVQVDAPCVALTVRYWYASIHYLPAAG
jgi:hypothetical protein